MTRRTAGIVVAASLAVKLAMIALVLSRSPGAFQTIDSGQYLGTARALVVLGRYAPDVARAGEPEILRTPGYPLVAAASIALFGDRTWPLSVFGAGVSALTALVILFCFSPPFPPQAAAWAAVLVSVDPASVLRSPDILTETLFTFLLVAALAAYVRLPGGGAGVAVLSGLALGAATLVRPIALYLGPVAFIGLGVACALGRVPPRRAAAAMVAFAAPVLVFVGGWIARNEIVAGFGGLGSVVGHQLLHRRAASVVALAEGITLTEAQERLGIREAFYRFRGPGSERDLFGTQRYEDVFPATCRESLVSLDRKWERQAWEIFRAHPILTAQTFVSGTAILLFSPPPLAAVVRFGLLHPATDLVRLWEDQRAAVLAARLFREHPAVLAVSVAAMLWLAFLWGAAAAGLPAARRLGVLGPATVLGVTLACLVVLSAGNDAIDERYQVPLAAPACLLAGLTLAARPDAVRPGR